MSEVNDRFTQSEEVWGKTQTENGIYKMKTSAYNYSSFHERVLHAVTRSLTAMVKGRPKNKYYLFIVLKH